MNANVKQDLGAGGGAFVGGVAMKKFKTAFMPLLVLGGGIFMVVKGKTPFVKAAGLGMAGVGAIGLAGKVAEKVSALQPFTPQISGMGDLYEDENGNIVEMAGINGPQLVQDQYGNSYMVEGLNGEEMNPELIGLAGDDLVNLVGDEYEEEEEIAGLAGDAALSKLV
jgi:hypothetical protein